MNKVFKTIYYVFLGAIVLIALLLVVSAFPITGNIKVLTVLSGSMQPEIKTGSVVIVRPVQDYKINDIITFGPFSKTKPPTTHRIHDIKVVNGQPIYITKGDANNAPDTREIQKKDVIGKVLFDVPYVGFAVDVARKPFGFALIIIVPAALIIFDEGKKIVGEIKKRKEEKHDS
jgi:signal peptidase